jgi:5-methylcytosine-specific restriction endonuclease McrA
MAMVLGPDRCPASLAPSGASPRRRGGPGDADREPALGGHRKHTVGAMSQGPEQRRLARIASAYNVKAERLGRPGRIEAEDLARIALRDRECPYCGITLAENGGTFDHRMPLDRGGANAPSNIVRCCWECQRAKYTKTDAEFIVFRAQEFHCTVCGRTFQPRYADLARGYAKTCSRSCAAQSRWAAQDRGELPVPG